MYENIFQDKWIHGELPFISPPSLRFDTRGLISMGSCFSRNINRWLLYYGLANQPQIWDILYNPFSIKAELERLFKDILQADDFIVENDATKGLKRYRDPWRTWLSALDVLELIQSNKKFDQLARKHLQDVSAFLFTYGLSEIWYPSDKPHLVLNRVPIEAITSKKSKYSSRFATIDEVKLVVADTIEVVRTYINPIVPIIFTLSPVPLKYTASELPTRVANNLSKSVLRVAIHEVIENEPNTFYYPSFEIIEALTEQERDNVWQADGRHITAAAVDLVARLFYQNYDIRSRKSTQLIEPVEPFWVPFVDTSGRVSGRLYTTASRKNSAEKGRPSIDNDE